MTTGLELLISIFTGSAAVIIFGPWVIRGVSRYFDWCEKIQKKWDDK